MGGRSDASRFSVVDMAALGGVLSALLLLALVALIVLVHKHYGHRLKCCCGKALVRPSGWGKGQERGRGAVEKRQDGERGSVEARSPSGRCRAEVRRDGAYTP